MPWTAVQSDDQSSDQGLPSSYNPWGKGKGPPANAGHIIPPEVPSYGEPAPGQPHSAIPPGYKPPSPDAGGSSKPSSSRYTEIPAYLHPLFDKIETGESKGKNVLYGGKPVPPGNVIPGAIGPTGQPTHAFNEFQMQVGTWNDANTAARAQGRTLDKDNRADREWAALYIGRRDYKARTGHDLDKDAQAGKIDYAALGNTWSALAPKGGWQVTSAGKWDVDNREIRTKQSRGDGEVVWYDPHDFLGDLPSMDDEKEPAGARQKQELDESLDRGDKIEEIPHLDVRVKNGKAEVFDYDGRHRAQRAIEEGVTAIPVFVKGIPKGTKLTEFQPMRGEARKWDFKALEPVPRETADARITAAGAWPFSDRDQAARQGATNTAHLQAAGQKTYVNEAGLPFTLSGAPQQQTQDQGYTGSVLPLRRDESGLHAAWPEMIAEIVRGAIQGGEMARGVQPVTEILPPEVTGAAAALGGAPLPPGSRFTPRSAGPMPEPTANSAAWRGIVPRGPGDQNALRNLTLTPEGQEMAAAAAEARAEPLIQHGPPSVERITPERAALAREAEDKFGIPVYGRPGPVEQQRALARAVSHTFGEDAPALTPEVLGPAKRRMGKRLNEIEQGHNLPFDQQFRADMHKIELDAESQLTTGGQIRVVKKGVHDVMIDPIKAANQKSAPDLAKVETKGASRPTQSAPPPKPMDIARFLISRGGIKDSGGELRAMDFDKLVPGYWGRLSHAKGTPLDEARELAVENGYLHPDSDINDLLNALHNTTHGSPVFSENDPLKWEWDLHQEAQRNAVDIPFPEPSASPASASIGRSGLTGPQFANLIHEDGPISKLANHAEDGVARFGQRIEDATRDLLQRRLPPEQKAEYQALRHQYKNLKTVEPAVGSTGQIDPVKLDRSVGRKFPNRRTDESPTDLMRLADIANEFVKKPPAAEGGAGRNALRRLAEVGVGAGLGHLFGGPFGAAVGAAAALGGETVIRNALRPRLTESLIERALAAQPPPGARRNAINALMSRQSANSLRMLQQIHNARPNPAAAPFRAPGQQP
jgi:hypothetical protein